MRNVFIIFIVLLLSYGCEKQASSCFSPGTSWFDNNGQLINAHGGNIIFHNNRYYWYGENIEDSIQNNSFGINCYSSTDLYNWKKEAISFTPPKEQENTLKQGSDILYPKVIYNERTKNFVMWFQVDSRNKSSRTSRTGVAVSKTATGPFQFIYSYRPNAGSLPLNLPYPPDSILKAEDYVLNSPAWMEAVNKGLYAYRDMKKGQTSYNMTLFVDNNLQAYHIYSSEDELAIHIAELYDDYLSHTGKYVRIPTDGYNETIAFFRRNDKYFLITSVSNMDGKYQLKLYHADNIMGKWSLYSDFYNKENSNDFLSNLQNSFVFPVNGKKDAYIFIGDYWQQQNPDKSYYVWLPILFKNDEPYTQWQDKWDLSFFD